VSIHHGVPENHFIDALSGLAFLAGGIIALDRRPGNAIGPLMIAYVFVSYLGNWGNLEVPVLPLLGVGVGQWAAPPILAQIALSYPTGRLRTTFDRVVIGLIWAGAAVLNVVILLVFGLRSSGCTACAWEPAPFPRPARAGGPRLRRARQLPGGDPGGGGNPCPSRDPLRHLNRPADGDPAATPGAAAPDS